MRTLLAATAGVCPFLAGAIRRVLSSRRQGLFASFLLGAIVLSTAQNSRANGTYLLNETFNSMATDAPPTGGWTTTATNGSVVIKEYPFAADKSVRIEKPTTSAGEASLGRTLGGQAGKVAFEAKVMTRSTTLFKAAPYIYDGNGNAVVSIALNAGKIQYCKKSAGSFQDLSPALPFVANDWYMVRIVVDTNANTFDLFIDGVRKLQNEPVRNNPSGGTLGQVKFFVDGSNTGIMYVDNVKIWEIGSFVGTPPTPIFDVQTYGAVGNGTTDDTVAIQNAINACTGTGGSVYLGGGKNYLAKMLYLQSNMTFFIDYSSQLSSTGNGDDYPKQSPPTNNTQLLNCRRAQLYAVNCTNLTIDGGGTIYSRADTGQTSGVTWFGNSSKEAERPITIWTVLSDHVTIQNIYVRLSAMWTIVPMETDYLLIKDVLLNCDTGITHDGIDIVDCQHAVVQDCTVVTGDDSFVPKTGIRRGVDDLQIKNCFTAKAGSNSYKFGTASYGGFKNALIQDCYAKNAQYAAMVLMTRNGAEVSNITFSRIEFSNTGEAFFVFLGQQPGHPDGDVDKLGYMDNVHFTDILCSVDNTVTGSVGSNITGQIYNGTTYSISNLFFTNCNITFKGGVNSVPSNPPEWDSNQYPEVNMWGNLPAYGYWMRHVTNVTFTNCVSRLNGSDARPEKATVDTTIPFIRTDSDSDGMPDDWELQYFGSTTGASPTADDDGDGMTNYAEFVAGTNPKDPNDNLRATHVSSDGTTVNFTFRSVPLKRYQLEYCDDIATASWTSLGNIVAASSSTLTLTDTPGTAKRFYRLRALID